MATNQSKIHFIGMSHRCCMAATLKIKITGDQSLPCFYPKYTWTKFDSILFRRHFSLFQANLPSLLIKLPLLGGGFAAFCIDIPARLEL